MANSEFIEILSPSALKDLQTANAELVTMISNVDKVGTKMKGFTTPSGSDSAVKNFNAKLIQQEKLYTDLQIKLERYAQAQQQTAIKTNQLEASTIRLNKAKELSVKQLEREQAKLEASTQIYNKVQAKLNSLSNEYRNLAVKKELTGKLTDAEAKRYDFLSSRITKYDNTLKAVDASMGKYQRNVGNYSSAFNPLSNSINQLTREMPAFANSVQTGFMAISNNLPIFFDAIQSANAEIKLLRANGEATPTLFQKLTSSVLSWGTALSVGVTLLTVFGDEIVDAIFDTKAKQKADEEAKKAIEDKNKAEQDYIDTMKKAGSEEISRSQILLANASNVNMKMRDRLDAIKQLKERYPDYLGHLTNEQFLSGKTADAEERLNQALMKRGIAIALQGKLTEQYNKLSGVLLKINDIQTADLTLKKEDIEFAKKIGLSNTQLIKNKQLIANLSLANASKEKKAIEEQIDNILNLYNQYAPYLSAVRESSEAQKESAEETIKAMTNSEEAFKKNISALEKQLSTIDRLNPAYDLTNSLLQIQKGIYDQLFGSIKKVNDETKDYIELTDEQVYWDSENKAEDTAKAIIKLRLATEDYIKTLSNDAFNKAFDNIGLSSAKMFFDFDENGKSTFDKLFEGADTFKEKFAVTFQAVGDVAQDIFNKIAEISNQRFESQKINLEREYKIGLAFAGDSASARAEIEKQYQERQREIQKKEFKARKAQALVNIAIDTAQAIIATLARTPPPLGTGLAIAMGALGAIQAGIVASQQMPQFWKGTDNAPEGWALTQERGREIITDSKGNIKSLGNDKGATMTYLNKGDKVKTASETMDYLMFNNELNAMLTNNSIDKAPSVNIQNTNIDLSPLVKAINDKPVANIGIDKDGLEMYVTSANQTKEVMNRRKTFNGNKV
jgi:hypothetical protein